AAAGSAACRGRCPRGPPAATRRCPRNSPSGTGGGAAMTAREEILDRLRTALDGAAEPPPVPRAYRRADDPAADRLERLVDRLVDYKAAVSRCDPDALGATIATALAGVERLVVPSDVPAGWLAAYAGTVLADDPAHPLDVADLDGAGAVLTGCAVAIAETGTVVLDAGPAQGRRAITPRPDHH